MEGRLGAAFAPLAFAEFGVCLAADGGRFEERDGDGDDLEELTPLVWMPGGTGRFIFEGMFGWTAVATGAIFAVYPRRAVLRNMTGNCPTRPSYIKARRDNGGIGAFVGLSDGFEAVAMWEGRFTQRREVVVA